MWLAWKVRGKRAGKRRDCNGDVGFYRLSLGCGLSSEGMLSHIRVLCKAVIVISLWKSVKCRSRKQRGLLENNVVIQAGDGGLAIVGSGGDEM